MPATLLNGDVQYQYPDVFSEVVFNGASIMAYEPIEVLVRPDGWGRVMVAVAMDTNLPGKIAGEAKLQLDGTHRNFTYWGTVTTVTVS